MRKLFINLADTHSKREKGLMHVKKMSHNQGMLFKFPYHENLHFWMKNTYIPLDIAFLDDDGRIFQIEEMVPLSTKSVSSHYPCRYALEVNKGWFKKNDVKVGGLINGIGISPVKSIKQSQNEPSLVINPIDNPTDPMIPAPETPAQPEGEMQPEKPDVLLERSFRDILEDANIKGQKLIIMYQTKKGLNLPPKTISPPFEFEKDEDGKMNSIVKAWDEQSGGWKSFLVDNIMDIEIVGQEEKKKELESLESK